MFIASRAIGVPTQGVQARQENDLYRAPAEYLRLNSGIRHIDVFNRTELNMERRTTTANDGGA